MANTIEIILSGNTSSGTTGGLIDLYGDEPINLNLSITDIKDITKRKAPFSQTFLVPATKNNNILFSDIFEIGIDSKFDPRKKARAYILCDSLPIMEGNLQLLSIQLKNVNNIMYEVVIFGEQDDLISRIEERFLTDLDFTELNHQLTSNNIMKSWSGNSNYSATASTYGYYYPLIDYGYDWDSSTVLGTSNAGNGIGLEQMLPATYVKYVFDKIFSAAGYTYSSSFLSSTTFNQLIIPFNGSSEQVLPASFRTDRLWEAFTPSVGYNFFSFYSAVTGFNYYFIQPAVNYIQTIYPNAGYYDSNVVLDFFSADTQSIQKISTTLDWGTHSTISNFQSAQITARFYRSTYGGGTIPFYTQSTALVTTLNYSDTQLFETPYLNLPSSTKYYPVQSGETFNLDFYINVKLGAAKVNSETPILFGDNTWKNDVVCAVPAFGSVIYNNYIPKNIKQIDYVKSLITMFNLFIEADRTNPKKLIIEPRDIFYSSGTTRVWTEKLDLSQPVTEKLLSEQQTKRFKFTYKEDKDYLNDNYKTARNQIYGTNSYEIDNDFIKGEETISVLFSPTPPTKVIGTSNFIVPKIFKLDSNNAFAKSDSNVRILRKNPTLTKLSLGEGFKFYNTSVQTSYPYAGHLNHPFTGTSDYNFGAVDYVYYSLSSITSNNLVNGFYGQYLAQIADKDSKLITCYIKLTPADIATFSFRDTVFLDGLSSDGGHYFYVQSIEYSPTSNTPSKVELLKVKNKVVPIEFSALLSPPSNDTSTARSSLSLGGGKSYAPASITVGAASISSARNSVNVGNDNIIGADSINSFVLGSKNNVDSFSSGSTIIGSSNRIYNNVSKNTIFGSYNTINILSDKSFVVGDNNFISSGVTGVTLFSNNVTASTSNTAYFQNIATSSGSYMYVSTGGTNPTAGIVQLNPASSSATITTNKVQDNTYIMLTNQSNGSGIVGSLYILSRTAGTSFTIQSTLIGDDSNISWILFQPN